MVHLKNVARNVTTGSPYTTGNAVVKGPDGSTLATIAVNGSTGFWEYKANGQPGITTQEYTAAGQTKIVSGDAFGQAQTVCEAELQQVLALFGSGVMSGMAVTAPGSMQVQVGTGFLANLGVLHPIYTAENVAIGAADGSNPRIDRVVSRLTRTGTFAGRVLLAVVAGTPAGSPTAPALTQDANTWEIEVARVTVPAGASSIVLGNIDTTQRPVATGPVADGSVTLAKLAANSVDSSKIVDGSIALTDLASGVIVPGLLPGLRASWWTSSLAVTGGETADIASASSNTFKATPVYVPKATTLTGLGVIRKGGTSVSASGRLALYNAESDSDAGTLHTDGGAVDLSTTGTKTITGLSAPLAAGWYWAAIFFGSFSGSMTFEGLNGTYDRGVLGMSSPSVSRLTGIDGSHTLGGSAPTPIPAFGWHVGSPLVWIQTSGT